MAGYRSVGAEQLNRLILIRHGAAAGRAASGGDRERPLTPEGREAILALAPRLARFGPPESILCSPARRTRETLEILVRALNWTAAPDLEDRLYPGDNFALAECLRELDAEPERVLAVGHNPDVAELAARLSGDAPELREFRPGAAAVFEIPERWCDLGSGRATMVAYYVP